jgi:hypothetical protein
MAGQHASNVSEDEPTNPCKKPFDAPRLIVYGDITALTHNVGRTGLSDGGKSPVNNRTRP